MRKKNGFICGLSIIMLVYLLLGVGFFGIEKEASKDGTHLENTEGQEISWQIYNVECEVEEEILSIEKQRTEGILNQDIVFEKIETSRKYLQENWNDVSPHNVCYMELFYHSVFLYELGEQYEIYNNVLIQLASETRSYIIDTLSEKFNKDRELNLNVELQKVGKEHSLEIIEMIIGF